MTSRSELQSQLMPLVALNQRLYELKFRARELLAEHGIPVQPPPVEPVARVRVRLLEELTLPAGVGRTKTLEAGAELVMDEARFQRHPNNVRAELIGPVPPRPLPQPHPFGEVGQSTPYLDWLDALTQGQRPPEWEEWGIELPTDEKELLGVKAALWNAVLVHHIDSELKVAEHVVVQDHQGSAHVPVTEAMLWPTEALLTHQRVFTSRDAIRTWKATHQRQEAAQAPKYARGIQAAVDEVYEDGMSETETWDRFLVLVGKDHPLSELDNGWHTPQDIAGERYQFMVDSAGDAHKVTARDIDTGKTRSLVQESFYRYFQRAKASASGDQ